MENDLDMRSLSIIEHNIVFSISLLPPLATIKKTNIPYTLFNKLYSRTVMQNNTQYFLGLCQISNGVRLIPQTNPGAKKQEKLNSSYLIWFHEFLSERGYCNKTVPKLTTRIGKGGKIRYLSRFKSYTYSSFN